MTPYLLFQLRVPVHVDEEEVIGADQVEADTSGCEGEEHHLSPLVLPVEVVDDVAASFDRNRSWKKKKLDRNNTRCKNNNKQSLFILKLLILEFRVLISGYF